MFRFVTIIYIILFHLSLSAYASRSVKDIQNDIVAEEAELKKLGGEKSATVKKIKLISSKIDNYKKLVGAINKDISKGVSNLERIKAESAGIIKNIDKLKSDALKGNIFIIDNLGYADMKIIASSKSQDDTIAALEILSIASNNLVAKSDELNVYLTRLKDLLAEEEAGINTLKSNREERALALKNLEADEKSYKDALIVLKNDEAARNDYIVMLEDERKELDGRLKNATKSSVGSANKSFEEKKGKYRLFFKGKIIEDYGEFLIKEANAKVFHKGIKIRPDKPSDVVSVAEGTVVYADYIRGFENLIVVSHGLPYYTIYGNISFLNVSAGDKVSEGTVLGSIDVDPEFNSAYLYFEIRKNEDALNPNVWLSKVDIRS